MLSVDDLKEATDVVGALSIGLTHLATQLSDLDMVLYNATDRISLLESNVAALESRLDALKKRT